MPNVDDGLTRVAESTDCGFWDSHSRSSLCKRDNLCSECRNSLDYFKEGQKSKLDEFAEKIKEEIRNKIDLEDMDKQYHEILVLIDKILMELKEKQ